MRQEKILFEKLLQRVNLFLKFTGIHIDNKDINRSVIERLRNRWFYCINIIGMNTDVVGGIIYFIMPIIKHEHMSIETMTYVVPCFTICLLGDFKSYFFIYYSHHVNDIIDTLRRLQLIERKSEEDELNIQNELIKKRLPFLNKASKILLFIGEIGIATFAIGPLVITLKNYLTTGQIKLVLPFLVSYPFDAFNIRLWPFVYAYQLWSAWVAVFTVYGPDRFYYTCCAFIHIQFRSLQYDILRSIEAGSSLERVNDAVQGDFVELVNRHKELIRCVKLLEIIYSKSTLFNVLSSSLIICVTGFNVMAIEDLALMAPFISFLSLGLLQIFFFCYYGDMISEASVEVSDAAYNSQWYESNASSMRDCLFVIMRAQKACKLTAYGFNDINLTAYARILSTAWSYFALLVTMYRG